MIAFLPNVDADTRDVRAAASVHFAAQIRFPRCFSADGERQSRPSPASRVAVIPYADFTYFGLLLYVAVPTLILGLFGKVGWRWAFLVTVGMLIVQYHGWLNIRPDFPVREIWIVVGFAVWQW